VSDPLGQDQEDYLSEPGGPLDPGEDEPEECDDPPYFEE
jgi:hypothetical protein